MKAVWSFEMERTAHPKTQLHFRADFLYSAASLWESQILQQKTHMLEKYTPNEVVRVREAWDLAVSINQRLPWS